MPKFVADSVEATGLKWVAPAVASGPAFSAKVATLQTITSNTFTKIAYNAENFDTDNTFDSTTNYRFTPDKAGKYQISGFFAITGAANARVIFVLYKNGTNLYRLFDGRFDTVTSVSTSGSILVDMNGTTDYLEFYAYMTGQTGDIDNAVPLQNTFTGAWIRS